jgi:glycosyltransferase involved in cell wall biosynthesis
MPIDQRPPRVLIGNIYFSPASFGGATIVAENMARELKFRHGWDVVVVAKIRDPSIPEYGIRRYVTHGVDVIGVNVPDQNPNSVLSWHNENYNLAFSKILEAVQPDLVHLHCIQNMGATSLFEVEKRSIPLVVTVHDCWWLCERQFMINHAGRYCHQTKIDQNVCRYCVIDLNATKQRTKVVKSALASADLLLFPSQFHRDLHLLNGFDPERCAVNKNGVKPPQKNFRVRESEEGRLTFGFVGGPGPVKGSSLIKAAFNEIDRTDYELLVVDAAGNIGESWRHDPIWKMSGKVEFVPAYTQESIDDFFSRIDVLLFPSQWKESFGLTVREAMIRGVWVIATDAGGLSEDCIDGENATVIPMDGNPRYLRDAIENIFRNGLPSNRPNSHISLVADQGDDLNRHLRSVVQRKRERSVQQKQYA